jgi:hypothetical protein
MKSIGEYWFGEVALARPYFLVRLVLGVLAFDLWLNMLPEGAKYGVGAFNVAHFPVFGGFVPTPSFYLGVLAFTGVLALSQALYRPHPIAVTFIAIGYTIGWSCSLLDSAPYHYLLSLYLVCFIFFPMLSARAAFSRSTRAPLGSAWAYVLVCVTTAIMYFYVAAWSAAEGRAYWLPMLCCIGYLLATLQDRVALPALKFAVPPLMAAPIAFHLISLGEGWFPIYMVGTALTVFAPTAAIHTLGQALTRPARTLFEEHGPEGLDERASGVFYVSLLGLVAAPMVSMWVDLPGVKTGCTLTAIAMLFVMGRQLYLTPRFRPIWRVMSLFGACLTMWLTVTSSTARVDYYRNAATDAEVRGDFDAASELRDKATRYAR